MAISGLKTRHTPIACTKRVIFVHMYTNDFILDNHNVIEKAIQGQKNTTLAKPLQINNTLSDRLCNKKECI